MKKITGNQIAVGLIVNGIVIYILSRWDMNIAFLYTLLLFFLVFFFYREQIVGSFNQTLALIKAGNNG